jgi:hypothetical protein
MPELKDGEDEGVGPAEGIPDLVPSHRDGRRTGPIASYTLHTQRACVDGLHVCEPVARHDWSVALHSPRWRENRSWGHNVALEDIEHDIRQS